MNNQIKSRKQATSHKEEESDDKNAVAIVTSVTFGLCVTRFRCTRFSRLKLSRTRCRKSWNQFKGYDYKVHATSSEYLGKERSVARKNFKVPHQRRPYAMKFEDRC